MTELSSKAEIVGIFMGLHPDPFEDLTGSAKIMLYPQYYQRLYVDVIGNAFKILDSVCPLDKTIVRLTGRLSQPNLGEALFQCTFDEAEILEGE